MPILTLFAMAPAGMSKATVANLADGSLRWSEHCEDPALTQQAFQLLSGRDGNASGRVLGIHHKAVSCWIQAVQRHLVRPSTDRSLHLHRKSMNSALSSLKKSKCWFWLEVDSIFGNGPWLSLWKKDDQNR